MNVRAIGGLLLALMAILLVVNPPLVGIVRTHVLDSYQLLNSLQSGQQAQKDLPLVIVDLDDESQRRIGQWPWPRSRLGEVVTRLKQAGARVIAFDILFAEADRMGPDQDRAFAEALGTMPVVLAQSVAPKSTEPADAMPAIAPARASLLGMGADWHEFVQSWPGMVRNLALLEAQAAGLGFISIAQENDGVTRRLPLVFEIGDVPGVALSVEILRLYLGLDHVRIISHKDGIDHLALGPLMIPVDAQARLWLSSPARRPLTISAADVLDGHVAQGLLAGKIILIGSSAEGLRDLRTIANGARVAGVEIHAGAIAAILAGQVAQRPSFAPLLELALLLIFGAGLIYLIPRLTAPGMAFATLGAFIALIGLGIGLFLTQRWLIDGASPAIGIIALSFGINLAQWQRTELRRRDLRRAFDHYLAPAMIERLLRDPAALSLGGELREVTVLFADIRGFTALAESYGQDAEGLTRILNQAFTKMIDAVLAQEGTIDKMVGDSLIAFWNAPLDQPDHASRAVRAARGILSAIATLDAPKLQVGIGINTGRCFVGNMGSNRRFNYTAMGDSVNVASRLEAATKFEGVSVLIGEATVAASGHLGFVPKGALALRGRSEPLNAYTLDDL